MLNFQKAGWVTYADSPFLPAVHQCGTTCTMYNIDETPQDDAGDEMIFTTGLGLRLKRGEIALVRPCNSVLTHKNLIFHSPVFLRPGEAHEIKVKAYILRQNVDFTFPRFGEPLCLIHLLNEKAFGKSFLEFEKLWEETNQRLSRKTA